MKIFPLSCVFLLVGHWCMVQNHLRMVILLYKLLLERRHGNTYIPAHLYIPFSDRPTLIWKKLFNILAMHTNHPNSKNTFVHNKTNIHSTCATFYRQNRQRTYSITLMCVRQPLLQWKSNRYYATWVFICSPRYPACDAYDHLWPARPFYIFPQYLINGAIFGKKILNTKCGF